MAKKVDGVVEAVRYSPDGKISVVRAYERRGATYSDHVLLTREQLCDRLRSGKAYFVGQRKHLLASTFELGSALHLSGPKGQERVVTDHAESDSDSLKGAPIF